MHVSNTHRQLNRPKLVIDPMIYYLYLLIQFRVRHHSRGETLQLGKTGIIGRFLEVLRILIQPNVDGLTEGLPVQVSDWLSHRRIRGPGADHTWKNAGMKMKEWENNFLMLCYIFLSNSLSIA